MKLYYAAGSCSDVIEYLADSLDITIEKVAVDLKTGKTAEGNMISEIAGKSYVPVLVTSDGEVITEVVAISAYLCSLVAGQTLFPLTGMPVVIQLEWFNFIATEIHKLYQPKFRALFGAEVGQDWMEIADKNIDQSYRYIDQYLTKTGNLFLTGHAVSAADFYLYVTLRWAMGVKIDLLQYPALREYQKRMKATLKEL